MIIRNALKQHQPLKKHMLVVVDAEYRSGHFDKQGKPNCGLIFKDLEPLRELITTAQELKVPTIFTHEKSMVVFPFLIQGLDGVKLVCKSEKDGRSERDAFVGSELNEKLAEAGATTVIICGADADICVKATTMAAIEKGYLLVSSFEVLYAPLYFPTYSSIQYTRKYAEKFPEHAYERELKESGMEYYAENCHLLFETSSELQQYLRNLPKG